jgi:hypothetical protein
MIAIHPDSCLFITLDSCRYDTFERAKAPNLKAVGPLHRAQAPSYFTYGSHSAMFMGFTPGLAEHKLPYLNPKFSKIFKLAGGDWSKHKKQVFDLAGHSIVDGFNNRGYATIGSGAVHWFNTETETGRVLAKDFQHFFYPGKYHLIHQQLEFINQKLAEHSGQPVFVFLNVGETHVPYYFEGASWNDHESPARPFQTTDRSDECRQKQLACCEFVDGKLAGLLSSFAQATTIVCADHGDCWGEDGLWEHGVAHPMTLTVPLLLRIKGKPVSKENAADVAKYMEQLNENAAPAPGPQAFRTAIRATI